MPTTTASQGMADARVADRRGAHRAGLQRDIEIAAGQAWPAARTGGGADHQRLGMGGGIGQLLGAVAVAGQHLSVFGFHQDSAHRHLAARTGRLGLGEGQLHHGRVVIHRRTLLPARPTVKVIGAAAATLYMTADRTPEPGPPMTESTTTACRDSGERIAKALARAGLCSRREAERWIAEGRVAVNGAVLTTPAVLVTESDSVTVDGRPLPGKEPTRLWRYHKPTGVVTTQRDPQGRPTVFERLPASLPRVVSIGRLDLNSEGLLLLTNDGALARFLELPSTGWPRRYRVRVHGRVAPEVLARLKRGVTVGGVRYGPVDAVLDRKTGANAWLTVSLREGKNREVRRVLESIGLARSTG